MSNWIANKITAKNINNLHIYDENGLVDFNKIIPEPTEKKQCPAKHRYDLYPTDIVQPNAKKPWFNWYNWRYEYWGVATNADMHDNEAAKEPDTIWFDTQWACPYPIISKISKMMSNTELVLTWEDLENGYTPVNRIIWKNGKMIRNYQAYYDFEDSNISVLGDWKEIPLPTDCCYVA